MNKGSREGEERGRGQEKREGEQERVVYTCRNRSDKEEKGQ